MDVHADDAGILAAFGVDAIGVGGVVGVVDVEVEQVEVLDKDGVVAKAEGDVSRFRAILPEYRKSPEITKRRIYLETMEEVYGANTKVILDNKNNGGNNGSVLYLPLDKIMQGRVAPAEPEVSSNNVGKR